VPLCLCVKYLRGTQRQTRASGWTRAFGSGSALFLKSQGARVTVPTSSPRSSFGKRSPCCSTTDRRRNRRPWRADVSESGSDRCQPGVRGCRATYAGRGLGQSVIGEIQLAAEFLKGTIVAITGSNGKNHHTTLIGEILAAGGLKTLVGGNIGTPAISLVERRHPKRLPCSRFPASNSKPFAASARRLGSY